MTKQELKDQYLQALLAAGVDSAWAHDHVSSLRDSTWAYWNGLSIDERREVLVNTATMAAQTATTSIDFDTFATADVSGAADPDDFSSTQEEKDEAKEQIRKNAQETAKDAVSAAIDADDLQAGLAAFDDLWGTSGGSLLGYEQDLQRLGKTDSMTGNLTKEAQGELYAVMTAEAERLGFDPPATAGDAVDAFNALPTAADKFSLFQSVWETDLRSYDTVNVPGIGEVRIDTGEASTIRRLLPDMEQRDLLDAVAAGTQAGVPWQLVLFAADADDTLYEDFDDVKPPGRRGRNTADRRARDQQKAREKAMTAVAARVSEGQSLYGDSVMGYIHSVNPGLATALANTPYHLQPGQQDALDGLLKKLTPEYMASPHVDIRHDSEILRWLREDVGPANETRRTVKVPSDVDVKEAMRSLYRSWFLEDPNDSDLDRFSGYFTGKKVEYEQYRDTGYNPVTGSPGGAMPTAPTPKAAGVAYLRGTDRYTELFANKPPGMSEEDYVAAMSSQARTMLGDSHGLLATDAVQAGMRAGNPNAVGQQAVASGAAYQSSTFMDRLNRGANVFKKAL